jgi:hypothetical protein
VSRIANKFLEFATSGDVNENSASLLNNQASPQDVAGLLFSTSVVRSFKAFLDVSIDATTDLYEEFTLSGIYNGTDWDYTLTSGAGNSGVEFSITAAGQVQYTSGNSAGFTSGTINFRALALSQ